MIESSLTCESVFNNVNALKSTQEIPKLAKYMDIFEKNASNIFNEIEIFVQDRVSYVSKKDEHKYQMQDALIDYFNNYDLETIGKKLVNFPIYNRFHVSLDAYSKKFDELLTKTEGHLGLKLLIGTFFNDISFIAHFLLECQPKFDDDNDADFCRSAIKMFTNSSIPATFFPNLYEDPNNTIELPDIMPIIPTAFGMIDSNFYVGLSGKRLAIIELKENKKSSFKIIAFNIFNAEFSIISKNKDLFFIAKNFPPLKFINGHFYNVNVKYPLMSSFKDSFRPLVPPAVSDDKFFYSVKFGKNPLVCRYQCDDTGISYVDTILLNKGAEELTPPFTDLLPEYQEKKASISINGIFINFIFYHESVQLSRVFNLQTGLHIKDILFPTDVIVNGAVFDTKRVGFWIISNSSLNFYKNFTPLSPNLVDFITYNPKINIKKQREKDLIPYYLSSFHKYTQQFIGSTAPNIIFRFYGKKDYSLENSIIRFIEKKNFLLAQLFLTYVPFSLKSQGHDSAYVVQLLQLLDGIFQNPEFQPIKNTVSFVFLSCLDDFYLENKQITQSLLIKLFGCYQDFDILILHYLCKSKYFLNFCKKQELHIFIDFAFSFEDNLPDLVFDVLNSTQAFATVYAQSSNVLMLFQEFTTRYMISIEETKAVTDNVLYQLIEQFISCTIYNAQNITDFNKIVLNLVGFFNILLKHVNLNAQLINKFAFECYCAAFLITIRQLVGNFFVIIPNGLQIPLNTQNYSLNYNLPKEFLDKLDQFLKKTIMFNRNLDSIQPQIDLICKPLEGDPANVANIAARIDSCLPMMPQLFDSAISYLQGQEVKILIKKSEHPVYQMIELMRSTFNFQNHQLDYLLYTKTSHILEKNWEKFLLLKTEDISDFINYFNLRINLPIGLLLKSNVQLIYPKNYFTTGDIVDQYDRLSKFINQTNLPEIFIEEVLSIPHDILLSIQEFPRLTDTLLSIKLIILRYNSLYMISEKFKSISETVIYIGFTKVIAALLDVYDMLFEYNFDDSSFIEYCIDSIGDFLSLQRVNFDGNSMSSIFEIVIQISAFLRKNMKEKMVYDTLMKKLKTKEKSNIAAFFAICNNHFEIPRFGKKVSIKGKDIIGTVQDIEFPHSIVIKTEKGNVTVPEEDIINVVSEPEILFDNDLFVNDFDLLIDIFENFKSESSIIKPLYYSSLASFCSNKIFASKLSQNFVQQICEIANFRKQNETSDELEFMCSLGVMTSSIPVFSFDSSKTEIIDETPTKILTVTDEFKKCSFEDILLSMENSEKYISTPLPVCTAFEIILDGHCNSKEDEYYGIYVVMLGEKEDSRFMTEKTFFKDKIEIVFHPESKIINVQNIAYEVQPRADMMYFIVELLPDVVLSYKFKSDLILTNQKIWSKERKIVNSCNDLLTDFPYQDSFVNMWSLYAQKTARLCSIYCGEAVKSLILISGIDLKFVAKFIIETMRFNDFDPESKDLTIKSDLSNIERFKGKDLADALVDDIIMRYNELKDRKISFENKSAKFVNEKTEDDKYYTFQSGDCYIYIPKDDIDDSILELHVDIRHLISLITNICTDKSDIEKYLDKVAGIAADYSAFEELKREALK